MQSREKAYQREYYQLNSYELSEKKLKRYRSDPKYRMNAMVDAFMRYWELSFRNGYGLGDLARLSGARYGLLRAKLPFLVRTKVDAEALRNFAYYIALEGGVNAKVVGRIKEYLKDHKVIRSAGGSGGDNRAGRKVLPRRF